MDSPTNSKITSTLGSLMDDKYNNNNILDFSGYSHKRNLFAKKFNSVLNEFSPSHEKNLKLDFDQRFKFMSIKSKLESNVKPVKIDLFKKIQDIKDDYFYKNSFIENNKSPMKSFSKFDSNCKKSKYEIIIFIL